MSETDAECIAADSIRVTITLGRDVYDEIRRQSRLLGLRPATWIAMVTTSRVRGAEVAVPVAAAATANGA